MSRENSEQNILGGEMAMLPFSGTDSDQGINESLLREYAFFLANKAEGTIEAYLRTVRQVMIWIAARPGHGGQFQPHQLTSTTLLVSPRTEGLYLVGLNEPEDEILKQPELHLPMDIRQRPTCD